MARPRRSEHTRQALLDLGVSIFSEKGYHGTGIKEILDAAQVPKGSFYNFFDSKEDFAVKIIEHYGKDLLEKMDQAQDRFNQLSAADLLRIYSLASLAYIEEREYRSTCLLGTLAAEIASSSNLCRATIQNYQDAWLKRIRCLVERGQKDGSIRQDVEADTLALLYWNQWQGSLLQLKVAQNPEQTRKTLDALLDVLYSPEQKEH